MRHKCLALSGALLLLPLYGAFAASFSSLVVFGDSLSDAGNAFLATGGAFPGPNYATRTVAGVPVPVGYYTDGPNTSPKASGPQGLWIDQLATRLGVADPAPFLAPGGGTNLAVASAQSGTANPQDVGNQVAAFVASSPVAPSSALYTFWAGSNDILNRGNPVKAADLIYNDILTLASKGAKNFLWLNVPLLGNTPVGAPARAGLNIASVAYNTEWEVDLQLLMGDKINVKGVDIGSLSAKIAADPGSFGLTNITDPARTSGAATDAGYLYWDTLHPTTFGHELIADAAFQALNSSAVPEPSAPLMLLTGLVALCGFAARKRLIAEHRR